MSDVKRILCPIDFSTHSEAALRTAMNLAAKLDAEVRLLHVLPNAFYGAPPFTPVVSPTPDGEFREQSMVALKEFGDRLGRDGVPFTTELAQGVIPVEVVRVAKERDADLIVMGTHGRTGLAHMMIGSVAERVVRTSTVPVLTVPKPE